MRLVAVTVTFNSGSQIRKCLMALRTELPDVPIIVVDNGSTDDTSQQVAAISAVQLVQNEINIGFGQAANLGARLADGTHLLFLNPDATIVSVDDRGLDLLLQAEPFGLRSPKILSPNGIRDSVYEEIPWQREILDHTILTLRPHEWQRRPTPQPTPKSPWLSGSIFLARRSEFLQLGGFDKRFFMYYEDRDLSARARARGLPIEPTDVLLARHAGGASSGGDPLRAESMAWAFLGWLEYLYSSRSPQAASAIALLSLRLLQSIRFTLHVVARTNPSPRVMRKTEQLDAMFLFLDAYVVGSAAPTALAVYPHARQILGSHGIRSHLHNKR